MEKKEAVREWCIEKAMDIINQHESPRSAEDIIKSAKQLEKYVVGED